ncbi:hypothetical protein HanRHA438_Chr16g0742971 [Helianthus annuus]|nr:hypothetical protein HanIR_Chr16g0794461 [Helianthus annuus]KAJ0459185.1 hypothetical protein HanHA89_Chr16g0646031 [Helianthus annuus]KAJ0639741.1 hypothetical protein HanLR1_Chr16g0607161 [Helianthus annuus]KAJ0643684.1 hypothetical protein HanOQP8_Chr16g0603291 [Helianthus annuus]KAJ0834376.1 hypothetical protein HanRHA438_Chr16g0742971 [Helianthus annuus]
MLLFSSKQTRILRTTLARVQFRSKLKGMGTDSFYYSLRFNATSVAVVVALVDIHMMVVCPIVAIVLASATLALFLLFKKTGWLVTLVVSLPRVYTKHRFQLGTDHEKSHN